MNEIAVLLACLDRAGLQLPSNLVSIDDKSAAELVGILSEGDYSPFFRKDLVANGHVGGPRAVQISRKHGTSKCHPARSASRKQCQPSGAHLALPCFLQASDSWIFLSRAVGSEIDLNQAGAKKSGIDPRSTKVERRRGQPRRSN